VIFTGREQVKVMDFGLAKLAGRTMLTKEGSTLGTASYMSPEQAAGRPADQRSDIWSLGVVLYEMVTGRRPFEGDYEQAVIYAILNDVSEPVTSLRSGVPMELERIIEKALSKKAEERYQSMTDLLVDLKAVKKQLETGVKGPVRSEKESPVKRRILYYAGGALFLILLVVTVGRSLIFPSDSDQKAVAVLPLENLMGDAEQQYFVDGMTEELIGKLSRIHALRVPARTSVLQYGGTQKDVKEIGRELGVGYIVEGSVRRSENRLRVSVKLIDVSTGFNLWSDDFDGEFKDVFAVQEETALKIVESLDLRLNKEEGTAIQQQPTEIPEAYDEYLRGYTLISNYYTPEFEEFYNQAKLHFEKALEYDPDYPLALSGLAHVMVLRVFLGHDTSTATVIEAEALVHRALSLEPALPEAYNVLGDLWGAKQEWERAAVEFQKAVKLEPKNDYAWSELGWVYNRTGRPVKAEKASRTAIRINPTNVFHHFQLGRALYQQDRTDEAIEVFQHAIQLNPKFAWAQGWLGMIYYNQGDYSAALNHLEILNDLEGGPSTMVRMAAAYAGMGREEEALVQLENGLEKGYRDFDYIETTAGFDSLRTDPRFQELVEKYRPLTEE
jgi:serine/threonine-protein kinase